MIDAVLVKKFTSSLLVWPDLPIQFRRPCLLLPAALGLLALLAINNNSSPIDALPGRRFTFIKHVPANLLLLYDSTVGRPFKNKPKCHQFGSLHYVYNNNEPSLVHTMLLFLYIAFKLDFAIVLSITLQFLMGIRWTIFPWHLFKLPTPIFHIISKFIWYWHFLR